MIAFLSRLLGRPTKVDASHLTFTVYSRQGCTCCHKALDLLRDWQPHYGFQVEVVDVDTDPALAEQHGMSVPVVALNSKVRFRGLINPALLERLILAECQNPPA